MPLVNMKIMLEKAKEGKYAVGQFNINNLEWTKSILTASQEKNAPVILGVSEGAARYMGGYNTVVNMVKGLMKDLEITVPVAIHLDHGTTFENIKKATEAGFTSVMYDGSHHPIDENIAETKKVVEYAHARGLSVEAEIGTVGGNEDGIIGGISYADKEECIRLVTETNIDCLAPALGSVHGPYVGEPKLGFTEMEEIKVATNSPLVLHGGTGIPNEQIKRAIACGTSKINVNTENQLAFTKVVREVLAKDTKVYDPRKVIGPGAKEIIEVVKDKIDVFGCANKASELL
ncbi:class II fructose-1,6-bisphosphate aldolase [Mycoplasmatota bacterium]|nr:class II fructose-1,6-bisphosphate aldolase [Mycoplasmatota bacterium]